MFPLESRQPVSHKVFNFRKIVAERRGNGLWGQVQNWVTSIIKIHSCCLTIIFPTEMKYFPAFCWPPERLSFFFLFLPLCHPCSPTQTPGRWDPSPQSLWHSCAGPWRGQCVVVSPVNWGMFESVLCPFHWWSWAGVCEWQKCRRDPFHWPQATEPGFLSEWRVHRPRREKEEPVYTVFNSKNRQSNYNYKQLQLEKYGSNRGILATTWEGIYNDLTNEHLGNTNTII